MKRQMKQHYLDVLHSCMRSGQNPTCRGRYGLHQDREKTSSIKDRGVPAKHRNSSTTAEVVLPKIVNR
ncbi:unnamed protein product [Lampetra planeri]